MDLATALIARYFASSNEELVVGKMPVGDLVSRYETPLFVYDRSVVDRKLALLRGALPSSFSIYYSVKANPNPVILRHFLANGCGLEIASSGELYMALQAGCAPDRILFAGPGKTEAELEFAVRAGVEIHVESALEVERISNFCKRSGKTARVALRVNPKQEAQGGAMRMGGKPAPFGIDEESIHDVLDVVLADAFMEFQGIHLFSGTQILDHAILIAQYRIGLEIGRTIARRIGKALRTIDFGGGLGIPYFANDADLDTERLKEGLAQLFKDAENEACFAGTRFVVEPGRYLIGEAGIYITRINDMKISRGKKFLIVDGGMNHHLAASGNLGQVIKRNFPMMLVNKLQRESTETVDVVGPLCTPLDTLGRDVQLPRSEVGDLLGIFQSGAYAYSASPLGFLSHPNPAEVLVSDGLPSLIRRRGINSDLSATLTGAL